MKAKKIFFAHRKAFSLVEIFIAMIIIAIFTSFMAPNVMSQRQTAKQEAEKLAAFLTNLTRKADRQHKSLIINFESDKVSCNADEFILTQGFTISQNFTDGKLDYDPNENKFKSKGTITLTGTRDNRNYYIHISQWRIRVSESPEPDIDEE